MKIYHICPIYKPSNGIYFVLKNLVPCQKKLGNEVLIINPQKKGYQDKNIVYYSYSDFKKLIETNVPDIVIFHGVFNKWIISFSYFLRKKKIPYFIELHGALSRQNMKTSRLKKHLYNLLFLNRIVKKAKGIIYLNQAEFSNSTISHLNANSLVIPNGCEANDKVADHNNEKFELLYIGRLDIEHKGLDIMIPAVKRAYENGVNLHLSLFGRGYEDEMKWLEKEIKGYEGVIDFYGEVFGKDKEIAFLHADVLLLTSRYEGFPITILEAISYGIPCIVTPNTNVSDIIENKNCGWMTDFSIEGVAKAILKSSQCTKLKLEMMGQQCIRTASDYSWERIADLSINEYSKLLTPDVFSRNDKGNSSD